MKKISEEGSERLHMTVSGAWVRRVDEWRRQQPDLPNFSEAVRRLADRGRREQELKELEARLAALRKRERELENQFLQLEPGTYEGEENVLTVSIGKDGRKKLSLARKK